MDGDTFTAIHEKSADMAVKQSENYRANQPYSTGIFKSKSLNTSEIMTI